MRDEFLHPPSIVVPASEFAWFSICDLLQCHILEKWMHIHNWIFMNKKSLYKISKSGIGDTSAARDSSYWNVSNKYDI
jgi:hypothetical protein